MAESKTPPSDHLLLAALFAAVGVAVFVASTSAAFDGSLQRGLLWIAGVIIFYFAAVAARNGTRRL